MKTRIIVFACLVSAAFCIYVLHAFLLYNSLSEEKTKTALPEKPTFDFFEFDLNNFQKHDEIVTNHVANNGESFLTLREYFSNEKTGEELIKISKKTNGNFLKGYYFSKAYKCAYYDDNTMKLFTGETGKIYCFENSKLKYISETRICKRLFSSVYVITYFDGEGNRTAVETQAANHSENEKAKRFLYNRFYGKSLLPISSKRFKKNVS